MCDARIYEDYREIVRDVSIDANVWIGAEGLRKRRGEGCDGREKSGKRRPQSFNNVTALTGPGK